MIRSAFNNNKKKIWVVHASVGHGHKKAAQAIFEAFQANEKSACQLTLVDVMDLMTPFFRKSYSQSYFWQVKRAPWLWGIFYFASDNAWLYKGIKPFRRLFNHFAGKKLEELILSEKPDVVIATHFLAVEVLGHLKRRKNLATKLITVITDYLPHWVWIDKAVDFYMVALEDTARELQKRGVPSQRVKAFGIPVEKKFLYPLDSFMLLKKIGLQKSCFTVLLTSGGAGTGHSHLPVDALLKLDVIIQVLVVCGTNEPLFTFLSKIAAQNSRLKVFAFVDFMHELMAVSDIVVAKGGGLTTSEALAMEKPLILFQSLPGQESRNGEVLSRHHAATVAPPAQALVAKVYELAKVSSEKEIMRAAAKKVSRPLAAEQVAAFIKEQIL